MKKTLAFLAAILLIYLAGFGLAAKLQRSLIYSPDKTFIDPDKAGIEDITLVDLDTDAKSQLYMWHLQPAHEQAPVILYLSGQGSNIAIWSGRWRRIKAAGAGFIALSYPGYGGSTGTPTEQNIHRATKRSLEWALKRYDRSRIIVHGFSLGTGPATKLVRDHPGLKALILEAPYLSVLDRAQEWFPLYPVKWVLKDTYMTKDWIGEVRDPVLVVHGDADRIIGFHHGKAVYELANAPRKFSPMRGGSHLSATKSGLYPIIWDFVGYRPPA